MEINGLKVELSLRPNYLILTEIVSGNLKLIENFYNVVLNLENNK